MLIAALCSTAGADTVRVGRWQMDFTGPKGVQLTFDGVPVIRKSTLYAVAPGWTKVLYDQSATKHQIQSRADGAAQIVTIDGANDVFKAHYEVTLRPDDTATVALTYQLLQDAPAEFEYCAGYFNANLISRRRYTADTLGGPREGIVPFLPPTPEQAANDLAPNWSRLTFDSRLGELTLRVRSDEPRVMFFDARRDPQPWAQDAPVFWFGLGSPVRPIAPHQEQHITFDLVVRPGGGAELTTKTQRHTEGEKGSGKEGVTGQAAHADAPASLPIQAVPDVLDARVRPALVIPRPKEARFGGEPYRLSERDWIVASGPPEASNAAGVLFQELAKRWKLPLGGVAFAERAGTATTLLVRRGKPTAFAAAADASAWHDNPEGYLLEVKRGGVRVEAGTPAGAFYGVQTLVQLLRPWRSGGVRVISGRVADWPSFPFRGAHLFPSGADPAFGLKLIDRVISRYKMNRVVLEVENARWKSHPELQSPQGASVEQLAALRDRSRERFVEIVPLIQSLGHAQWMFAGGQHTDLAEDPDHPYAYCPSNPKSYELLFDIYDEAIKLFQPRWFHIGHDEVTNQGRFPHDDACTAKGLNRLFAENVQKLTGFLKARGVQPMLWGDMLLHATEVSDAGNAASPEAARELRSLLPKEAIITDWHYAGVPVYPSLKTLRGDGFDVVAASWWNPLNVAYLARAAVEAGARGLLQTTWVGRYPTEKVLTSESRQFTAMLLAAEYAWSGRTDLPDEWDYSAGELFTQAWAAGPPDLTVRPGALASLDRLAALPLADTAAAKGGWLGLGAEHDLSAVPQGRVRLSDVLFSLPTGHAAPLRSRLDSCPSAVAVEVPLGRTAAEVALLNATGWRVPAGTRVARLTAVYADDSTETLDLVAGRGTAAWTDPGAAAEAPVAWRGRTRAGDAVALRLTRWHNPHPERPIRLLRFEPLDTEAAWTLFGVSLIDLPKG